MATNEPKKPKYRCRICGHVTDKPNNQFGKLTCEDYCCGGSVIRLIN